MKIDGTLELIARAPDLALSPECLGEVEPATEEVIEPPITVYSRRETDEDYEEEVSREGDLRIVTCRDDLQWIVQRFSGGQWRSKSFHRTRQSLIQRYGALEMFRTLPEHHDGLVEVILRCKVCSRIKSKPTGMLPRHMFCLAERKPRVLFEKAACLS